MYEAGLYLSWRRIEFLRENDGPGFSSPIAAIDLTPDDIYMLHRGCCCETFPPAHGQPNALPDIPTAATDPGAMPEESTEARHPRRVDETKLW